MSPVYIINFLFLLGILITVLCRYSWYYATQPPKKERNMTRKAKFTGAKSRSKEIMHLDYLRVYHEVLKYEEVLDIEIDVIYEVVVSSLQRKLARDKLTEVPEPVEIDIIIKEVMDKLTGTNKPGQL